MLATWILGISVGVVLMSTIWISFQSRSMHHNRVRIEAAEQHMREHLDDMTAAQLRRDL